MANISWTSSSINSFFNTSLNTGNSPFSNVYSSLGDASMIKSGVYKKLMKSYVNELKSSSSESDKTTSSDKTDSSKKNTNAYTYDKNGKKTGASIKNTVLDELLEHKPYSSQIKNSVLDKLLEKDTDTKTTTTPDGTVTEKTETSAETVQNTTQASEAVAGAIIDESV